MRGVFQRLSPKGVGESCCIVSEAPLREGCIALVDFKSDPVDALFWGSGQMFNFVVINLGRVALYIAS